MCSITDNEKKIVWAEVRIPERKSVMDCGKATVVGKIEGSDEEIEVFGFYEDEINFTAGQFIGKTLAEAGRIRHEADVRYLQDR